MRNDEIRTYFSRRFHCSSLDPSNSALLLDSSRSRTISFSSSCVRMCGRGHGNSFAVRNWTESRWYNRINYCPLLFLRDASRNKWHHTEVAASCLITWFPPNHRKSKRHRMRFAIQLLRKIFCTFTAAYVRGPGFVLVTDLASGIQMIHLFHYRGDGLSLPCKRHFITNVKIICTINTVTRHH